MNIGEKWIDIKGYEGYYQISNFGRVKRLKNSPKCKKDRILRKALDSGGYEFVYLSKLGIKTRKSVHRLVLENFQPTEGMENLQVNHIDENRTNNYLTNLEWATRSENLNYGHRAENYGRSRGKKVRCIETGIEYYCTREAERRTGIAHTHISESAREGKKGGWLSLGICSKIRNNNLT